MRRKFILVGLVLALFVFPYVLNIGEAEAQGKGMCRQFQNKIKKIQCFKKKVRKKNQVIKDLRADMQQCKDDLYTVSDNEEKLAMAQQQESKADCSENKIMNLPGGFTINEQQRLKLLKPMYEAQMNNIKDIEHQNKLLKLSIFAIMQNKAQGKEVADATLRTALDAIETQAASIDKIGAVTGNIRDFSR